MPNEDAAQHPYELVARGLREEILSGQLAASDRIPSEWELAAHFGMSRPTIRRAIAVLKAEGLVVTEQGRGTYVRPKPRVHLRIAGGDFRRHRAEGRPGFNAQVIEQGLRPEQRLLEVTTVRPPEEVAIRLTETPTARVLVRRRLFVVDGQPVAICDSYYRMGLARGTQLEDSRRIRGGVYALIEDPEGPIRRRLARSIDEVTSRMPTRREASALNLGVGVPVLRVLRTVYDTEGGPIEVQESVASAELNELRYEVILR